MSLWGQKEISDSTKAIFFFGTPFNGLNVENLLSILPPNDSMRGKQLLSQLRPDSNFLRGVKESLKNTLFRDSDIKLYSYFESGRTAEIRKVLCPGCGKYEEGAGGLSDSAKPWRGTMGTV